MKQRILLSGLCLLAFIEASMGQTRARAFAAPTGPNALDVEGSNKPFFKIGPTRDGITRAIADEVDPGVVVQFVPDVPNDFPAYDDNFVQPNQENELFIPSIYKNETEKEKEGDKKVKTTPAPVVTNRITRPFPQTPRTLGTQPPPQFIPTRAPPQFATTRPPPQFVTTRAPPQFVTRPPPQFVTTRPPPQFATRPPPPAPVPQQNFRPQPAPFRPVQPQPPPVPRPVQQPQQFVPRLIPATPPPTFRPQPQPQPRPQPQPQPRPQPQPPPQAQLPFTPAPRTQPFRPQPRPSQPFQPRFPQQPAQSTPAPRPLRPFRPNNRRPFRPQTSRPSDPTGLRTGTCPFTIFYQSVPASQFDVQQTYTHFAVVVSVDQCARTCHEFNCAMAFFDPINRHCQFNVRTGAPQNCPAYPSPFLRNNVPLTAVPLRIDCITCQRRRRTNRIRSRFFTSGFSQRRQFNPQVVGRSFSPVIHGVLLRQPQSYAIGFGEPTSREFSIHSSGEGTTTSTTTSTEVQEYSSTEAQEYSSTELPNSSEVSDVTNAKLIRLQMHKLFPSEASEESKEQLTRANSREIDNSTEDETSDSNTSEQTQPVPKKILHKTTGITKSFQRIPAADKAFESREFA